MRVPIGRSGAASDVDAFHQPDRNAVAGVLLDDLPQIAVDGELVCAIAERHERTPERVPVHGASHLHQAASTEELGGARHDYVRPTSLCGTRLEHGSERLPQ